MFPFRIELDSLNTRRVKRWLGVLAFFPAWGLIAFFLAVAGNLLNVGILTIAAWILAGCSFAACVFLVGYSLFFRMQWRLLELLATLTAGTIPTAIMIRAEHLSLNRLGSSDIVTIVLCMVAGLWVAFTGSIGGAMWLNELGEQRSFHRLAILFLAWGGLLSIGALAAGIFLSALILGGEHVIFGPHNRENWQYCILAWSTLLIWIPILIVNSRYRSRGGVNAQR